MTDINIREATLSDLDALLPLEQEVLMAEVPFNNSIKTSDSFYYDIPDLISSANSYLLVAEVNHKIIATGYAQIRQSKQSLVHEQHSYLGFMYVDPKFRGKGLNQQLIKKLINWSKSQNIKDFYLDVYSGNQAAIRAYEKLGFAHSMIEMKLN